MIKTLRNYFKGNEIKDIFLFKALCKKEITDGFNKEVEKNDPRYLASKQSNKAAVDIALKRMVENENVEEDYFIDISINRPFTRRSPAYITMSLYQAEKDKVKKLYVISEKPYNHIGQLENVLRSITETKEVFKIRDDLHLLNKKLQKQYEII